jgi:hypothetical protein
MLPKTIGAKVAIQGGDVDAKRYVEWDGFWPEDCSGGILTMRRDFPSGTLAYPQPGCGRVAPHRHASRNRYHFDRACAILKCNSSKQ